MFVSTTLHAEEESNKIPKDSWNISQSNVSNLLVRYWSSVIEKDQGFYCSVRV
jgi:hypothetical protein